MENFDREIIDELLEICQYFAPYGNSSQKVYKHPINNKHAVVPAFIKVNSEALST